jgi:hypothetical protein
MQILPERERDGDQVPYLLGHEDQKLPVQRLREGMAEVNIFDQAKRIPNGVRVITEWLGSGGQIEPPAEAQRRADICKTCPMNVGGMVVTTAVAMAVKQHLAVKNQLQLRVSGEKSLHLCSACGCVLRLLIWQPIDMVRSELSNQEAELLPPHCWKLSKQA